MNLDKVKEINTVNLGPNDFLIVNVTENMDMSEIDNLSKQLAQFMNGKLKGKVIIVSPEIKFTKVSHEVGKKFLNGKK